MVDLVAAGLEHESLQESATEAVTQAARYLGCERVSIGLQYGSSLKIIALSQTAEFDERSALLAAMTRAMAEAMDQQQTLLCPPAERTGLQVILAQEEYCQEVGAGAVCTVPLFWHGRVVGALLLEKKESSPFAPEVIKQAQWLATLLGPLFEARRQNELSLPGRIMASGRVWLSVLFGRRSLRLKVGLLLFALLLAFFSFFSAAYRISGHSTIEAGIQRAVVAPQDGFVATATARAGDRVMAGELLASLEDKDLLLERQKWLSKYNQMRTEYRHALAGHKQSEANILKARISQAEALLRLVEKELARTRLVAPIDGLIISGDLTQSLGAPVQRGDVLYEVAPLADYRLIVQVDEQDIGRVSVGQTGALLLAALVDQPIPFTVSRITPVSVSEQGRTFFRVEARLPEQTAALQPGMEGIARIDAGQRSLLWLATHKSLAWLRLRLWRWQP